MRIPNRIFMDERLEPSDKLVYAVLEYSWRKKGGRMPTNKAIGKIACIHEATVSHSVSRLRNLGLIEVKIYHDHMGIKRTMRLMYE